MSNFPPKKNSKLTAQTEKPKFTIELQSFVGSYDANNPREDKHYIDDAFGFYGVYDGHGGSQVSEYLEHNMFSVLQQQLKEKGDPQEALQASFLEADRLFIDNVVKNNKLMNRVGSCCIVAYVDVEENKLYIGNAGDCRAILGRRLVRGEGENTNVTVSAMQLSIDQNTNSKHEKRVVLERSGDENAIRKNEKNTNNSVYAVDRVAGSLMVTRAIGDAYLKHKDYSYNPLIPHLPYISAEPDVMCIPIKPGDEFVIMGSDGFWEHMTNIEAAQLVVQYMETKDLNTICQSLIDYVIDKVAATYNWKPKKLKETLPGERRKLHDDITIILVFFRYKPKS